VGGFQRGVAEGLGVQENFLRGGLVVTNRSV